MAQTTRRRGRPTNAAARNTTGGNSGTGNACKLNATAAAQYGQFSSLLAATGNYTIPQIVDQQSLWLISHMATAGTATTANPAGTTASKAVVAPTRARRTSRPAATAVPQSTRRTRTAANKPDLNQAILSVMPDSRAIQQSALTKMIQERYPNTWGTNIIGAGLARAAKAGKLLKQGGTGNKAVWSLPQTQAQREAA